MTCRFLKSTSQLISITHALLALIFFCPKVFPTEFTDVIFCNLLTSNKDV